MEIFVTSLGTSWAGSTAVIDKQALKKNLAWLKERSKTDKAIAVVKANFYGHGAIEAARTLESDVEQFAVATIDEAIQLRRGGIELPILVLGVPHKNASAVYKEYDLTASVSQLNHFELLEDGTEFHVVIDTGMRRLGIFPSQLDKLKKKLNEEDSRLVCRGVFSHYATAEDPGSDFVHLQNERFQQVRASLPIDLDFHMSNSPAVIHYDIDHFDAIRVGIGLTGYAPGRVQTDSLEPILTWQTELVQVRPISKGDTVSYEGSWRAPEDGYLGTLPVGYADGVSRMLSNRLEVRIDDKYYSQVGNVTMDYTMIFLRDNKLKEGSKVDLIGGGGWRADRWAREAGTITHEIICGLSERVRREYR